MNITELWAFVLLLKTSSRYWNKITSSRTHV